MSIIGAFIGLIFALIGFVCTVAAIPCFCMAVGHCVLTNTSKCMKWALWTLFLIALAVLFT